jgi:hypothetical protein
MSMKAIRFFARMIVDDFPPLLGAEVGAGRVVAAGMQDDDGVGFGSVAR